jgi:hypothetical protein
MAGRGFGTSAPAAGTEAFSMRKVIRLFPRSVGTRMVLVVLRQGAGVGLAPGESGRSTGRQSVA